MKRVASLWTRRSTATVARAVEVAWGMERVIDRTRTRTRALALLLLVHALCLHGRLVWWPLAMAPISVSGGRCLMALVQPRRGQSRGPLVSWDGTLRGRKRMLRPIGAVAVPPTGWGGMIKLRVRGPGLGSLMPKGAVRGRSRPG